MSTWYAYSSGPRLSKVGTYADEQPGEWYHGSAKNFDRFNLKKDRVKQHGPKHWNSHLGTHFTSEHSTAYTCANEAAGHNPDAEQTIYHCSLAMKNPKHFTSEFDMDRDAHSFADNHPDFEDGLDQAGHSYDPEANLRHHPKVKELAAAYREHLKSQGHDGVTYGNEYEGSHLHECAIAFRPKDITIEHAHGVHDHCAAHEDEESDFDFKHTGALTRHFASDDHEVTYHITDDPHFALDPHKVPEDNSLTISGPREHKGLYTTKRPEHWINGHGYVRPYLAEIHHPKDVGHAERWGGEGFIPAKDFDKAKVHRVIPLDAHAREEYGGAGWIEEHHGTAFDTGKKLPERSYHAYPGYHYPGPDVREMSPEQHAEHHRRWVDYMVENRGHDREDFEHTSSLAKAAMAYPAEHFAFPERDGKDVVYLRFGNWHHSETSRNYVTGHAEHGVSVYELDKHGHPADPDPHLEREHEHDKTCEPDCDLDDYNEEYGNDSREEMDKRKYEARKTRNAQPGARAHLVKGEFVGIGHDGEPLLQKVHTVGHWPCDVHKFVPGADKIQNDWCEHPDHNDDLHHEAVLTYPGGHGSAEDRLEGHSRRGPGVDRPDGVRRDAGPDRGLGRRGALLRGDPPGTPGLRAQAVGPGDNHPALEWHPRCAKDWKALAPHDRKRIGKMVDQIVDQAPNLKAHPLKGRLEGWRAAESPPASHRVVYRSIEGEAGRYYIGHITAKHDYGDALNRLSMTAAKDDIDHLMDLLGPSVKPAPPRDEEAEEAAHAKRVEEHQAWQAARPGINPGEDISQHQMGREYPHAEWVPIGVAQHFRDHSGDQHHGSEEIVNDIHSQLTSGRGMTDPLMLLHHNEDGRAHLGEGNHRLAAAERAGWTHVPMRVVRMYDGESRDGKGRQVPYGWRGSLRGRTPEMARPSEVFHMPSLGKQASTGTDHYRWMHHGEYTEARQSGHFRFGINAATGAPDNRYQAGDHMLVRLKDSDIWEHKDDGSGYSRARGEVPFEHAEVLQTNPLCPADIPGPRPTRGKDGWQPAYVHKQGQSHPIG